MKWVVLRERLISFKEWCEVDGNYIFLLRAILVKQGYWWAIDKKNEKPPSKLSVYMARLSAVYNLYLILIGLPMSAYSSLGQPLEVVLEPIVFAFIGMMVFSNAYCLLFRSDTLQMVVNAYKAMAEVEKQLPDQSLLILRKRNTFSKYAFVTVVLAWNMMISGVLVAFPYLWTTRTLYLRIWLPFDNKASMAFEINLASMAVMLTWKIVFFQSTSCILGMFLIQASSHLDMLSHNIHALRDSALRRALNRLGLETHGFPSRKAVNLEMEIVMRSCVRHHQAVIRLMATLEEAFSNLITLYLTACLIPASLTILTFQKANHINFPLIFELMILLGLTTGLLGLFYFANRVTTKSELIRDAVFSCDWLRASDSFKRSMRIMLSRSNQPLVLTVGWGIPITLDTFQDLITLTYKFNRCVNDINKAKGG